MLQKISEVINMRNKLRGWSILWRFVGFMSHTGHSTERNCHTFSVSPFYSSELSRNLTFYALTPHWIRSQPPYKPSSVAKIIVCHTPRLPVANISIVAMCHNHGVV